MAYVIPDLQNLLDGINSARAEYIRTNPTPNPERLKLLDILDATAAVLSAHELDFNTSSYNMRQEVCLGAYLFCLESIKAQYLLLYPEGYLLNSGSTLYKLLFQELAITDANKLSEQKKLVYLSEFYDHAFKHNREIFKKNLAEKNINISVIKKETEGVIKSVFNSLDGDVTRLINAVPTETAIDGKMSTMLNDYLTKAIVENADRRLLAKIAVAFSQKDMLPTSHEKDEKHFLSRTQRIKMGLLLTIMQSIWDSYYIRNPTGKSILYDLCLEALNITKIEDIEPSIRLACVSTFNNYISCSEIEERLEINVNDQSETKEYIDPVIEQLRQLATKMTNLLQQIVSPSSFKLSSFAMGMGAVLAIVAAAPGYGAGYTFGYAATQLRGSVPPKLVLDKVMSPAMMIIFNKNAKYLGYFAANMIVDATLERAFAKTFEALAVLLGASAGCALGFVIYDLSYKTLKNLCTLYKDLHANLGPNLAKDADPQFIECLENMPSEIFAEEQKIKVKRVTEGVTKVGIFGNWPKDFFEGSDDDFRPLRISSPSSPNGSF